MAPQRRDGERHWAEPWAGWLAAALAFGVTLWRASPSPQWRDDLAVVRGLGFVPIGGERVVSSVLIQLFGLLPVGGRLLRAAAVGALGAALAAVGVYLFARLTLGRRATPPGLSIMLAFGVAMLAAMSPSWQLESTVGGGASLGAAFACFALLLANQGSPADARVALGTGVLLALAALESRFSALVGLGAVVVSLGAARAAVPPRSFAAFLVGAAWTLAIGLLPAFLRPFSGRAWLDLGFGLAGSGLAAEIESGAALSAWSADLGPVACGLAGAGAVLALFDPRVRPAALAIVLMALADLLFTGHGMPGVTSERLAAVRLLGIAALCVGVALGVAITVGALSRARIPYARAIAVLLIAFTATLALVAAEESFYIAERRRHHAADVWTDEALATLPPRSLVLVSSEAIAWRLWAARVSRGSRPDVLIVPLPLIGRGALARKLLVLEPGLEVSVRDMAMTGRPSEYALSSLADLRPVFVEVDASWDPRLLEHVLPVGLWARFWPHAVGSSDRRAALVPARAAFERVALLARASGVRDEATLAVLRRRGSEHVALLRAVQDARGARELTSWLERIWGEDAPPALAERAAASAVRSTSSVGPH